MKKLILFGILLCLLSSLVAADCTITEDINYCTGTISLDDETFTDSTKIVIFESATITAADVAANVSLPNDGTSQNISITAASIIFEDSTITALGTDGTTPTSGDGGAGGDITMTLNVGAGSIGFYNSQINLTSGAGAYANGGTNLSFDGGEGGDIIIYAIGSVLYLNSSSSLVATTGDGGDAEIEIVEDREESCYGGRSGKVKIYGTVDWTQTSELNITTGNSGNSDAAADGANEEVAADGVAAGNITFTLFEGVTLAELHFTTGAGGNGYADVGTGDTGDQAYGGAGGLIYFNVTDLILNNSVGSTMTIGNTGASMAASVGTGTGSAYGRDNNPIQIYANLTTYDSTVTFNLGDGGDGEQDGGDIADGGAASDFLIDGNFTKMDNTTFTINAGSPGAESGSEGADGDMSDIKFQSSVFLNTSDIKTIQDTTNYYCNRGGSLWIIGEYFNISSSTVVMNASTVGGDSEGSTTDCNSGGGGDVIVRADTGNFEDGSLTITTGPGGRGTGGATEIDGNSGPIEFNISSFNMDNFTLNLGTADINVVEGGSVVGNMEIYFDNISWSNVTFNWHEGDPTDAVISIVNITERAIIDNNSLINFTTNPATASTADYWYFGGWETRIFDTQLTNTSNTDLQYTVKTEGWPYQDEHNYMFLDNLTCSGEILVANNTVSSIVHNRTQGMTACTVTWETGITEENESVAEWNTRIFNVTPRGNGSLDWPNDGWNCYTDFEVYNSSVVNVTSNNFSGTHSVGDTIWCSLNLSLAADFDFARNKSTTTVAPYPYNWSLYIGDQNATWTGNLTTLLNDINENNTAAYTTLASGAWKLMKNLSVDDWDTRNNKTIEYLDIDVDSVRMYWRDSNDNDGECTCYVKYVYTDSSFHNSSAIKISIPTSGTWRFNNFSNPSSKSVDYAIMYCKEDNPGAGNNRCETTNTSFLGTLSYRLDYSEILNGTVHTTFRGGVNYWNQYECTDTTCYVPINFTSNSSGSLWNLSNLSVEWGQSSATHGDYQVPIVITSESSGMFNLSNWIFEYYNDTEIEMNVTTNTSINRIINISHSKINFSQAYDYIEFYPTTLSSKKVTPWGQNSSVPFFNITYDANRDFEIAILLNESMPSCMNISGSKDNNSQYHVLTTSAYALTNMTVNDSLSVWLNLDLEKCNRTALHALYTVDAYFDTCCDGCVSCW